MLNKIISRKNDVNPLFKNKKKAGKWAITITSVLNKI